MALLSLFVTACSLSMVFGLHILPCEPGMSGPLGCDSFFSGQQSEPTVAIEPEFRDRGLGDLGFGERFGGLNSEQFFDGGSQDQFFDGGVPDQFFVGGQDQFIGAQEPFIGGGGVGGVSGGFDNSLGVIDNSFSKDQGFMVDTTLGLGNSKGDTGSFGMKNMGMSSKFGKGKSRGVMSSSIGYPKGISMSKKSRGSSFPSIGKSGINSGMLGFARQRGYPKFQDGFIGMSRGMSRSSLSYPKGGWSKGGMIKGGWNKRGMMKGGYSKGGMMKGGWNKGGMMKGGWNKGGMMNGGWNKGGWRSSGSQGWRGKGYYSPMSMNRGYFKGGFKGFGRDRMSSMGSWGQGMSYPKGISRPSFTPTKRRSSGGY
ncbi:uncharacterized protein [Argopecten irradians]|uniref:uncharacterized protein n=1 Tax=Argopecten irradians TaxID=31199 RepID=UPI003719D2E4